MPLDPLNVGYQVGGALYDQLTMAQQNQQQEELMNIQQQNNLELMNQQFINQQGLNQQGHNLQFDMWNKTNYGAQMQHLRDAGLNPALMYGKGGQGGNTGSQGGGSAAGGSAGLGMAAKAPGFELYAAQKNLMEAQANDLNAKADATRGYQKDKAVSETTLNETKNLAEIAGINLTNQTIEKIATETDLMERTFNMDYDEKQGISKNTFKNMMNFLGGKFDTSTYIGAISGALTVLPIAKGGLVVGKAMTSGNIHTVNAARQVAKKLLGTAGISLSIFGLNKVISNKENKAQEEYNEGKTKFNLDFNNSKMTPEKDRSFQRPKSKWQPYRGKN